MADILTQKEMDELLGDMDDIIESRIINDTVHRKVIKIEEELEYTIADVINETLKFHDISLSTVININEYKRNNYYEIVIYYKGL